MPYDYTLDDLDNQVFEALRRKRLRRESQEMGNTTPMGLLQQRLREAFGRRRNKTNRRVRLI